MKQPDYRPTLIASYGGYVTQAIINNLSPLLFVVFHEQLGLSLTKLALLVTLNFTVQLIVDMAAARYIHKIGCRTAVVAAHFLSGAGLISMGILTRFSAYPGLIAATVLSALGGGLIEVIISPIVQALPGERKAGAMSLLHSFYCWGSVLVVLLSTLYFRLYGAERWHFLPILWAMLPLVNGAVFCRVPLARLEGESGHSLPLRQLFKSRSFVLFMLMMLCAGASELSMAQWASFFAEVGLGVPKTVGDLLGPCLFAVMMGSVRLYFGLGREYRIERVLGLSAALCVVSYLVTSLSPSPVISLLSCGITGLSVAMMWPGLYSLAADRFPRGGVSMFAVLALFGDVGCAVGPSLVGVVSESVQKRLPEWVYSLFGSISPEQAGMKSGILLAVIFPVALLITMLLAHKGKKDPEQAESA